MRKDLMLIRTSADVSVVQRESSQMGTNDSTQVLSFPCFYCHCCAAAEITRAKWHVEREVRIAD